LKEIFWQALQYGWASPDVISYVNRCNKAIKQDVWCMCWMKQMIKLMTADEMELASELCLAAALTYPVPCLMEMTKQIVDTVLFQPDLPTISDDANTSEQSTEFKAASIPYGINPMPLAIEATVLAKMLLRVLTLLIWAEDRRQTSLQERKSLTSSSNRKRKLYHSASTTSLKDGSAPDVCLREFNGGKESKDSRPPLASATKADSTIFNTKEDNGTMGVPLENTSSSPTELIVNEPEVSTPSVKTSENNDNTDDASLLSSFNKQKSLLHYDAVQRTILNVFERFEVVLKDSCIKPAATFIIFFMHELARAPRTEYWRRLVEIIPMTLLFTLARLDPGALPLSLFKSIYDVGDDRYRMHCLKYAVMMHKFGMI